MKDNNYYFGVKSKGSIINIDNLTKENLNDNNNYDVIIVAIETSNSGGNGDYDIVFWQNNQELSEYEINEWNIISSRFYFNWGESGWTCNIKDSIGFVENICLSNSKGSMGGYDMNEMILEGFARLLKFTKKYDSHEMFSLCEKSKINSPSLFNLTFYAYQNYLKEISLFLNKAYNIKNDIKENKKRQKDSKMYDNVLCPKILEVISYMKNHYELSSKELLP